MRPVAAAIMCKNEATIIARCLASVKAHVDFAFVIDTGSSDGTPDVVRNCGVPAIVISRSWRNFGHNRSELLREASKTAQYLLLMDADQTFHGELGTLTAPAYNLQMRHGSIEYPRVQIVRTDLPWRYEGVTHEFITCDRKVDIARHEGAYVIEHADSSRRTTGLKTPDDIALLEQELSRDPYNARTVFYLARCYADRAAIDPGLPEARHWQTRANELFACRVAMGGWMQEVYVSLLSMNNHLAARQAIFVDPNRWEAYHIVAKHENDQGNFGEAYRFARSAMEVRPSKDCLFLNTAVYETLLQQELERSLKGIEHGTTVSSNVW